MNYRELYVSLRTLEEVRLDIVRHFNERRQIENYQNEERTLAEQAEALAPVFWKIRNAWNAAPESFKAYYERRKAAERKDQ